MAVSFDALTEAERVARLQLHTIQQFVDRVVEVRSWIRERGLVSDGFIAFTRAQASSLDNLPNLNADTLSLLRDAVFRELPPCEHAGEKDLTAHEIPYVLVVDASYRYSELLSWDDDISEDERLKECHKLALRIDGLRGLIADVADRIGSEHGIAWEYARKHQKSAGAVTLRADEEKLSLIREAIRRVGRTAPPKTVKAIFKQLGGKMREQTFYRELQELAKGGEYDGRKRD